MWAAVDDGLILRLFPECHLDIAHLRAQFEPFSGTRLAQRYVLETGYDRIDDVRAGLIEWVNGHGGDAEYVFGTDAHCLPVLVLWLPTKMVAKRLRRIRPADQLTL